MGGLGTDPDSMVPMAPVVVASYLEVTKVPATETAPVTPLARALSMRERFAAWREAIVRRPAYLLRSMIALGAVGIVLLGAAPMALASMNHNADPIIAQATNGTPNTTNVTARNFHLVSQSGQPVSLQTLHGKTVALTFLDPVCVSQCPLIAQEFRQSDTMLGSLSHSSS